MEFFLVRIFLYSDSIRRFTLFSPNIGKYGPEKTPYLDVFPAVIILGPLLIIIFAAGLFYINDKLYYAGYTDDTIPYVFRFSFEETIDILESTIQKVSAWFKKNKLIIKLFVFVGAYEKINLRISDSFTISNRSAELFKIAI